MTAAVDPVIVVVLPWGGDRLDLLLNQLDRLVAQDVSEPLEVRVALNRPADLGVRERIVSHSREGRTVLTVDASARPGPSHARNCGADPTAPILLFCDADDEVDLGWAKAMAAALRSGADLAGGVLDYEPLNAVPFALSRADGLPVAFGHLPFSPSASLAVRGEVFRRLNGFDEGLTSGEDIDLCWRAQYSGASIAFVPAARTAYRLRQSGRELFDQGRRYGRSDVHLYQRHREHGLSRTPLQALSELVRVMALAALAARGRAGRLKLAAKAGTVVGHVQGSVEHRVLFL